MNQFLSTVGSLTEPLALALILTYGYCLLERNRRLGSTRPVILGVMFGLAALVTMHSPIVLADGIYLDLRNLFLGISAAVFGFWAGLVTLLIACAMRIYMAGAGVGLGIAAMLITFGTSLMWRYFIRGTHAPNLKGWSILGAGISLHVIVGVGLPDALRGRFFIEVAPMLVLFHTGGTILLGLLINNETSRAIEALRLEKAAATDPLTKLLNRRSTEIEVGRLPPPRSQKLGRAMLTFDVDHFKKFNDEFGHATGDAVLQAVTARVKSCLRPNDIFSRIGGDEFLIVLPEVTSETAQAVSERCRAAVNDFPISANEGEVFCTISIGAEWRKRPPAFAQHLEAADRALYQAKKMGRNCVAFGRGSNGGGEAFQRIPAAA